jgi:hypothetical protein
MLASNLKLAKKLGYELEQDRYHSTKRWSLPYISTVGHLFYF